MAKELANRAEEAPIGRVLVEIRRFVRLIGEGVLLVCRATVCWAGLEIGALVGNLASKRLLVSVWWFVVMQAFASSLVMPSM